MRTLALVMMAATVLGGGWAAPARAESEGAAAAPADPPSSRPQESRDSGAASWPQFRGPSRDGVAASSPGLAGAWPTNGPALLWRSEWKEREFDQRDGRDSGCNNPVVADGRVFVYATVKMPKDGGKLFKPFSREVLLDAGWLPDLPDELAKKIEDARLKRPMAGKKGVRDAPAWFAVIPPQETEIDAYVAKSPDLDKYITDFVATLKPEEAKKYGAYIKRRFCMYNMDGYNQTAEYTWDELVQLSKMQDRGFASIFDLGCDGSGNTLGKDARDPRSPGKAFFSMNAMLRATRTMDTIVCMDEATGRTLWKKEFPVDVALFDNGEYRWSPHGGFDYLGVGSVPAVWKGRIYAMGLLGMYCLSTRDGTVLWKAPGEPEHASPLVADGIVYNRGVAYDAETGRIIWKDENGTFNRRDWYQCVWSSPQLWTCGGTNYVITVDSRGYCALELKTGRTAWTIDGSRCNTGAAETPVVHGDVLVTASPIVAFKMTPTATQVLWSRKDVSSFGPLVHEGAVYTFCAPKDSHRPQWHCLDLATGKTLWTQEFILTDSASPGPNEIFLYGGSGDPHSTPVLVDGKIIELFGSGHFSGNGYGLVQMVKASSEGYRQLAFSLFNLRIVGMSSPAVANGRMFLRLQDGGVGCWDLRAK